MERRAQRAFVGVGSKRAGNPGGAEKTLRLESFFPWQDEPGYCDAVSRPLSQETRRYFDGMPTLSFTPEQMSWCQRKRAELEIFVLREFPTVLAECFQAPVDGAIFGQEIDKLRVEGSLLQLRVPPSHKPTRKVAHLGVQPKTLYRFSMLLALRHLILVCRVVAFRV